MKLRKKALSLVLTGAMIVGMFAGFTVSASATTEITDLSQITNMSGDYKLADSVTTLNINASTWTPIGTPSAPFTGTFDGNGKTINWSGSTAGQDYYGIFGKSTGTVQNLKVEGSLTVTGNNYYVSPVVGYNAGTVSHCSNSGNITGYARVGGIVGENAGTITSCYNIGNITGTQPGKSGIGGITGSNGDKDGNTTGTITNVYNLGKIVSGIENNSDSQGSWVGGIAGFQNTLSTITNAYNAGNLSAYNLVKQIVGKEEGHSYNVYRCTSVTGSDTYEQQDTTYPYTYSTPVTTSYMKTSAFLTDVKGSTTGIWTQNTNKYPTLSGTSNSGMSIQLISLPTTLSYTAGQYFDDSGMLIQAIEVDGTATTITSYSISNPNALTVSDTTMTVSGTYNSQAFSFTFAISVENPAPLTLGPSSSGATYNDLASALNAATSGGTIEVLGPTTISISANTQWNNNVTIERSANYSGSEPMFTVSAGSNILTLTSMTFKGDANTATNTDTIFGVSSGTLRLRGGVKLQDCAKAVEVSSGGALTVNKAQISANVNSIINSGTLTIDDFGNTSITGQLLINAGSTFYYGGSGIASGQIVYLNNTNGYSDAYIMLTAVPSTTLTVQCANPDVDIKVAQANNSTDAESAVGNMQYATSSYELYPDGNDILLDSTGV